MDPPNSAGRNAAEHPKRGPGQTHESVEVVVRVRPLSTVEHADPSIRSCIQCLKDSIVVGNARGRSNQNGSSPVVSGAFQGGSSSSRGGMGAKPPLGMPTAPSPGSTKNQNGTLSSSTMSSVSNPHAHGSAMARPYQFCVNQVFHTHSTQIEVYEQACKRVVEGVFKGINGSILAYGATGSGKTHTMFGSTMSAAGVVYQAVRDMLEEKERLEAEGRVVQLRCSFVEIYNEEVYDLLVSAASPPTTGAGSPSWTAPGSSTFPSQRPSLTKKRVPLQVREMGKPASGATANGAESRHSLVITGMTYLYPKTMEEFTRGIERGHAQRFVAATGANAQSSRSHAIITVEVQISGGTSRSSVSEEQDNCILNSLDNSASVGGEEPVRRDSNDEKKTKSKKSSLKNQDSACTVACIRFGDLAGSERAASTSNTGLRLREGANINCSLLALGSVVQSLAQQKKLAENGSTAAAKKLFVPYRASKLTRLLRDAIGGNCRTLMLFCVSPSSRHVEETINSMKFAMNAKEVQVNAQRNEFSVNSVLIAKSQERLIEELRAELAMVRAELGSQPRVLSRCASVGLRSPFSRQSSTMMVSPTTGPPSNNLPPPLLSSVSSANYNCVERAFSPAPRSSITALTQFDNEGTLVGFANVSYPPTPALSFGRKLSNGSLSVSALSAPSTCGAPDQQQQPQLQQLQQPLLQSSRNLMSSGSRFSTLNQKSARQSVFLDNGPVFTELETKLKAFSAEKESLQHALRDALERQRDCDIHLREQKWRLATFLVSSMTAGRDRGEADRLSDGGAPNSGRDSPSGDGNGSSHSSIPPVGVAGLRETIALAEAENEAQAADLALLTEQLDTVDRSLDMTRKEFLFEPQGTMLELLLDNARLRQNCTEAECLAAQYHQECRISLNRQSEYAEALEKCVSALRGLLAQSFTSRITPAAIEVAHTALLYALLPTTSTPEMIPVFEASLKAFLAPTSLPLAPLSHPPPLAPTPTKLPQNGMASYKCGERGGVAASGSSALRGGGQLSASPELEEHYKTLMQTASLFNATNTDGTQLRGRRFSFPPPMSRSNECGDGASDAEATPPSSENKEIDAESPDTAADLDHTRPKPFAKTYSTTGLTNKPTNVLPRRASSPRKVIRKGPRPQPPPHLPTPLQRTASAPPAPPRPRDHKPSSVAVPSPAVRKPKPKGTGKVQATHLKRIKESATLVAGKPSSNIAFVRSNTAFTLRTNAAALPDGASPFDAWGPPPPPPTTNAHPSTRRHPPANFVRTPAMVQVNRPPAKSRHSGSLESVMVSPSLSSSSGSGQPSSRQVTPMTNGKAGGVGLNTSPPPAVGNCAASPTRINYKPEAAAVSTTAADRRLSSPQSIAPKFRRCRTAEATIVKQ